MKNEDILGANGNTYSDSLSNLNNSEIINFNAIKSAFEIYKSLNTNLNQSLGIDAVWFLSVPDKTAQDVIFQEYTLYNVSDCPINVKVIVKGDVPENTYNMDILGLNYNVPLEITIDKIYWQNIAGSNTMPQEGDIVYIPLMNRLYEVNSSYVSRGFMQQETAFVCSLIKYNPKSNRKESDNFKNTAENYTVSMEELFGDAIEKDIARVVDKKEFSPYNSTQKDIFKIQNANLNTVISNVIINGTAVTRSFYDMSNVIGDIAVDYKTQDCLSADSGRSYMCWFKPHERKDLSYNVNKIERVKLSNKNFKYNYKLILNSTTIKFRVGDIVVINRGDSFSFPATIINTQEDFDGIYYVKIEDSVVNYLNYTYSNWLNVNTYSIKKGNINNLLTGSKNDNVSLSLDILDNKFIRIVFNKEIKIIVLDNKFEYNTWYGLFLCLNSSNQSIDVYVYEENTLFSNKVSYNSTVINKPDSTLSVKEHDLYFNYEGGNGVINIDSNTTWKVYENKKPEEYPIVFCDSDTNYKLDSFLNVSENNLEFDYTGNDEKYIWVETNTSWIAYNNGDSIKSDKPVYVTSKLILKEYKSVSFNLNCEDCDSDKLYIIGSDFSMFGIRYYSTIVDRYSQNIELLSYITMNGNRFKTIIYDMCEPKIENTYVADPR